MPVSPTAQTTRRQFCSVFAKEAGEDPAGSAWSTVRTLLIEVPLPWPYNILEARHIAAGVGDAVIRLYQKHPDWGVIAIAPDADYTFDGRFRIIDLAFGDVPHAAASRRDVLVHADQLAKTLNAIIDDAPLPQDATIDDTPYRDMLICTHGAIDICCATFGYPAYRYLKARAATHAKTRIWRASHFGGHRFAPTLLDLPDGRYWGFLGEASLDALLTRDPNLDLLRACYRGWSGYIEPAKQRFERECFLLEGWDWLTWPQQCEVVSTDDNGEPVQLRLTARRPDGVTIEYEGRIQVTGELETMDESDGEIIPRRVHRVTDVTRALLHPSEQADH